MNLPDYDLMAKDTTFELLNEKILGLQTTLDHVEAYVFTKDAEGRYTYANRGVCDLFGCPLDEIIGFTDEKFFDLSVYQELRENDRRVIEHGELVKSEETNVIAATGERRIYWTVKSPLRDAEGVVVGLCGISTDITERLNLQKQVQEQKQLLDTVLDNIDAYVYMKDRDRRYLYANPSTAVLLGCDRESLIGKLDSDLMPQEVADRFDAMDRQVLDGGKKVSGEETFTPPGEETRYYWSTKIPLVRNGEVEAYVGISSDITEVIRLKERFKMLSITDHLTGLSNRRYFQERGKVEFQRSKRYKQPLSLMMLDIDHFKKVNDGYGHAAGDEVLVRLAGILAEDLREVDLLGRLGGEEFGVLLPNTGVREAFTLAERIRKAVAEKTVEIADGAIRLSFTISIGVAEMTDDMASLDQLISKADEALYEAKKTGRNRVICQPIAV